MSEIAVCVSNQNEIVTPIETINAVCEAGFKNVFVQWYDRYDLDMSQAEQVRELQKRGINIIFAHLGYTDMEDFWTNEESCKSRIDRFIKDLDDLKEIGITTACMHVLGHHETTTSEFGFREFKRLVRHAKEIGVNLTFENTIQKGILEEVFDYVKDEGAGICVDVGHINCKFNGEFDYDHFKGAVRCVHIHDNLGPTKDLHLLPFDGVIDYTDTFKKLKSTGYDSYVTMELIYQGRYTSMDVKDFYKEGYQRGLKLQEIFDSIS